MGYDYKKTNAMISLDPQALENIASEIKALEARISRQFGFDVSLAITKAGMKDDKKLKPFYQRSYIDDVKTLVCKHCSVSPKQLTSPRRDGGLPELRYLCYQLIKDEFPMIGLAHIGRYFGGRDHSTVLHGLKEFSERIQNDENLRNIYQSLKIKLNEKRQSTSRINTLGLEG
jgi:chromosomal replication initiator protein